MTDRDDTNILLKPQPKVLHRVEDAVSGTLTYVGETPDQNAQYADEVWRLSRIQQSGTLTETIYAKNGAFSLAFADRFDAGIFPDPVFSNAFSCQYPGSGSMLDVPHISALNFIATTPFTIVTWIKTISPNITYLEKADGNTGYRFYSANMRLVFQLRGTGGAGDRYRLRTNVDRDELSDGAWHMLGVTYDGSDDVSGIRLFIDGVETTRDEQNNGLTTSPANTTNLAISSRSGGGDYFVGNQDECGIWGVELTPTQMGEVYNGGVPIDLRSHAAGDDLVGWYTYNQARTSFPTVEDESDSANDATLVGCVIGDIEREVPA